MPTASKDGENEPMVFLPQKFTDKPSGYKPTTRVPLRPVIENNADHTSKQGTTETLWKTSVESKLRNRPQDYLQKDSCPEKKKRRQRKEIKDNRKPSPDGNDLDKKSVFEKLSSMAKNSKPSATTGQAETSCIRSSLHYSETEDKEEQELVHILDTYMLQNDPKTEINTVAECSIERISGRMGPGIPMEGPVSLASKDAIEGAYNNLFDPIHKEGTSESSHGAVGFGAHERIDTEFQLARPQPFRPTIKEDSKHAYPSERALKEFYARDATPMIGCNPTSAFVPFPVFEEKSPT